MRASLQGVLALATGAVCLLSLLLPWYAVGGDAVAGICAVTDTSLRLPIAPLAVLVAGATSLCAGALVTALHRFSGSAGMGAWCAVISVAAMCAMLLDSAGGAGLMYGAYLAAAGCVMCLAWSALSACEPIVRRRRTT